MGEGGEREGGERRIKGGSERLLVGEGVGMSKLEMGWCKEQMQG